MNTTVARTLTMTAPVVHTPKEVAAILRCSARSVVRLCQSGRLRGVQVGRSWRVPLSAIVAFVEGGADVQGPPAEPVEGDDLRARETVRGGNEQRRAAARGARAPTPRARVAIPSPRTDGAGFLRLLGGLPPRKVSGR